MDLFQELRIMCQSHYPNKIEWVYKVQLLAQCFNDFIQAYNITPQMKPCFKRAILTKEL
jgi:hypothetical protein